jgi:hypothetical protein
MIVKYQRLTPCFFGLKLKMGIKKQILTTKVKKGPLSINLKKALKRRVSRLFLMLKLDSNPFSISLIK